MTERTRRPSTRAAAAGAFTALLLTACGGGSPDDEGAASDEPAELHDSGCPYTDEGTVTVTRGCVDGSWPLTTNEAEVFCDDGLALVRTEGGTYPLTGAAASAQPQLPDLEEVWAENPDIAGSRINISPLTQIALDLC